MLLIKGRVPSKELRERLGIGDIILILQQRNVWNMRWRAQNQEVQEGQHPLTGQYTKEDMDRGCAKRLPSTQFEQGGCYGSW